MGQVKIQVTLRNAREVVMARLGHLTSEQVRTYTTEALVDTGATRLTVPSFVADRLGIIRLGHTDAEYADGRVGEVDTTEGIQIEMLGRTVIRDMDRKNKSPFCAATPAARLRGLPPLACGACRAPSAPPQPTGAARSKA